MKEAILIQCHKNPDQVNMLLKALQHPDIDIYVHVDKKSDMQEKLIHDSNIYYLPDDQRLDVGWGSLAQIQVPLLLMTYASQHQEYEHYWSCSGQDFPIKPLDYIVDYLHSKPDTNFLGLVPSKNRGGSENNFDKRTAIYYPKWILKNTIPMRIAKRSLVEITGGYKHTFAIFKRKPVDNLKFYFNSAWFCISNEMWKWMQIYITGHPELFSFFQHVPCMDECFFNTMVMNSPYKNKVEDYLHYIDWSEGGNSPKVLTSGDFNKLKSSDKLMARKFDASVDKDIILALQNLIMK